MDLQERYDRYDELLSHFRRNILRYCASHARSGDECAVLVQEVMAALWDGVDGLRARIPSAQANIWLQRVMRSAVTRYRRATGPAGAMPLGSADMLPVDDGEAAELLDELASMLDSDERALLNDYRSGYTYGEMGERMGLSVATIRVRMYRLKKRLKTIYDKQYEK